MLLNMGVIIQAKPQIEMPIKLNKACVIWCMGQANFSLEKWL